MKLLSTKDVARLAGLTAHQVREWTERRNFVAPAIAASGSGTRNLFSWREVLILRLLAVARSKFGAELEMLRPFLEKMNSYLAKASFPGLWGKTIILQGNDDVVVVDEGGFWEQRDIAIVFPLDPHLEAIAHDLSEETPPEQLILALLSVQQ